MSNILQICPNLGRSHSMLFKFKFLLVLKLKRYTKLHPRETGLLTGIIQVVRQGFIFLKIRSTRCKSGVKNYDQNQKGNFSFYCLNHNKMYVGQEVGQTSRLRWLPEIKGADNQISPSFYTSVLLEFSIKISSPPRHSASRL